MANGSLLVFFHNLSCTAEPITLQHSSEKGLSGSGKDVKRSRESSRVGLHGSLANVVPCRQMRLERANPPLHIALWLVETGVALAWSCTFLHIWFIRFPLPR